MQSSEMIRKFMIDQENSPSEMTLRLMGLPYTIELPSLSLIKPYLIIPILFLGPLYAQFLSQELPYQANWSYEEHLKQTYLTFLGLRNHILACQRTFPNNTPTHLIPVGTHYRGGYISSMRPFFLQTRRNQQNKDGLARALLVWRRQAFINPFNNSFLQCRSSSTPHG